MVRKVLFRLGAISIGVAATLLVAEAVLQAASVVVKRTDRGSRVDAVEGELRIVCVGESTTYGLWPGQLEEILNEGSPDRVFRVINRGVVGIRTDGVANQIEGWLDEDRPHLVITMLGINDEGNVLVYPRSGSRRWLMDHSRTARLLALLWRTAFEIGADGDGHLDDETRSKLAQLERRRSEALRRFRIFEMIEIHRELIITDPGTPFYHLTFLRSLVLHHEQPGRLGEFFVREIHVVPSTLDDEQRLQEIAAWGERSGDRFAALRLAASVARTTNDTRLEQRLLEVAAGDPNIAGLVSLRMSEFAFRVRRHDLIRRSLRDADDSLPDDYQWSLLLGDISFLLEEFDLATEQFQRALKLRPDLPASHELMLLGRLANASEQAGEPTRAAEYRARRDELKLGRFREFTRHYYQQVVDRVRARRIPVIAMQYPLLPVESLRKLLDHREDVTYLENRANFEAALLDAGYKEIFEDNFAGSFGHLSPRGNRILAENVAATISKMVPGLGLPETSLAGASGESP